MGSGSMMPPLPDGFVLDQPAAAHPPLPEGFVLDQPQAPAPSVGSIAKQLATGAVAGTLGIPGDAASLLNRGIDWAAGKVGLPITPSSDVATSDQIARGIEKVTGVPLEPQNEAEAIARRVGGFASGAIGGPAGVGARLLRVLGPAAGSEVGGQLTKGTAAEPFARIAGAVAGGGAGALPKVAKAVVPTGAELKTTAQLLYKHPEVKEVEIRPQAVANLSDQIQNDLIKNGFRDHPESASGTFAELQNLKPSKGVQSVNIDDLDSARRALKVYAKKTDLQGAPTSQATAAGIAIDHLDDFIPNLRQPDLLKGNAQRANEILKEARGDYRGYKQAQLADTKMENARIQAASTYGGGNINNALRQAYRPLEVNNYGKVAGWSPEAKAALKDVVEGRLGRNAMRDLGRLAPTGPVNIGLHALNAAATGGASLPLAGAAYVAKKLGERGTKQAAQRLSEVLRSQTPLAQQRAAAVLPPAKPRLSPLQRRLMASALALPRPGQTSP